MLGLMEAQDIWEHSVLRSLTSVFGLCTGGRGCLSDLSESSFTLCGIVFCLLAFKGDLQADSHPKSFIPLDLCKCFNMINGN